MKLYVKELLSSIPDVVINISTNFKNHGYKCWLVGGCLRDFFMAKPLKEIDLATNAVPEVVSNIFPDVVDIGSAYGSVLIKEDGQSFEVTTLRKESGYNDARHPSNIIFCDNLKEDLCRRDFTINGLAYDPIKKELYDYYDSLSDIKNKTIKTIGEADDRFEEDALRMLRACRFASQLDFTIISSTYESISRKKEKLNYISKERIAKEFIKILESEYFKKGFYLLKETGIMNVSFPELTCLDFDSVDLLYFSKISPKELRIFILSKFLLERSSEESLKHFLYRLHYKKSHIKTIISISESINFFEDIIDIYQIEDVKLKYLVKNIGKENVKLWLDIYSVLNDLNKKDIRYLNNKFKKTLREPLFIEDLALKGEDLKKMGIPSGPIIGEILDKLLSFVIVNPEKNTWSYLVSRVKKKYEYLSP